MYFITIMNTSEYGNTYLILLIIIFIEIVIASVAYDFCAIVHTAAAADATAATTAAAANAAIIAIYIAANVGVVCVAVVFVVVVLIASIHYACTSTITGCGRVILNAANTAAAATIASAGAGAAARAASIVVAVAVHIAASTVITSACLCDGYHIIRAVIITITVQAYAIAFLQRFEVVDVARTAAKVEHGALHATHIEIVALHFGPTVAKVHGHKTCFRYAIITIWCIEPHRGSTCREPTMQHDTDQQ